jgi:hypothetical protein
MSATRQLLSENTEEASTTHAIQILHYWDIIAPSPNNTAKGKLMKGVFKALGKKRRVSLELHRIPLSKIDEDEKDENGIAIANAAKNEKKKEDNNHMRLTGLKKSARNLFGLEDDSDVDKKGYIEKAFLRISKRTVKQFAKSAWMSGEDKKEDDSLRSESARGIIKNENGDMDDDISIASSVNTNYIDNAELVEFPVSSVESLLCVTLSSSVLCVLFC